MNFNNFFADDGDLLRATRPDCLSTGRTDTCAIQNGIGIGIGIDIGVVNGV